jgi:hypothetical protein
MNLVLTEKGKRVCEQSAAKVESVLMESISRCGEPIRTYLNGALYSLLTLYSFRKLSNEQNILLVYQRISSNATPSFLDQINYIKERLSITTANDLKSEEAEDPQDLIDEDFDTDYEDVLSNSVLMNFIANSDEAINQTKLIEEYIEQKQGGSLADQKDVYSHQQIGGNIQSAKQQESLLYHNIESELRNHIISSADRSRDVDKVFAKNDKIARTPPSNTLHVAQSQQI